MPRADVYEMTNPDFIHEIIKGIFKDHLVTWVGNYVLYVHGEILGKEVMDDIDRR